MFFFLFSVNLWEVEWHKSSAVDYKAPRLARNKEQAMHKDDRKQLFSF